MAGPWRPSARPIDAGYAAAWAGAQALSAAHRAGAAADPAAAATAARAALAAAGVAGAVEVAGDRVAVRVSLRRPSLLGAVTGLGPVNVTGTGEARATRGVAHPEEVP